MKKIKISDRRLLMRYYGDSAEADENKVQGRNDAYGLAELLELGASRLESDG